MSTIIKTNYVAVQLADRSQPGIYLSLIHISEPTRH